MKNLEAKTQKEIVQELRRIAESQERVLNILTEFREVWASPKFSPVAQKAEAKLDFKENASGASWIRLPRPGDHEENTGLGRAVLSRLATSGAVRTISLRKPGEKRGCRLISLPSLLAYLEGRASQQSKESEGRPVDVLFEKVVAYCDRRKNWIVSARDLIAARICRDGGEASRLLVAWEQEHGLCRIAEKTRNSGGRPLGPRWFFPVGGPG